MENAVNALKFIIPILNKYKFTWVITGGFAVIAYGVDRQLTDIDIDIKTSKNAEEFKNFMADLKPYITQELIHYIDQNYDNYNFEITVNGQLIDICPMKEMKIINITDKTYMPFYDEEFNSVEYVNFNGLKLPLLSKEMILKNKRMLAWCRDIDNQDIKALDLIIGN